MKTRHIIALSLIGAGIIFFAGAFAGYKFRGPTPVQPITVSETPTSHTTKPGVSPDVLATCGEISITGAWIGDTVFRATAINNVEIAQKEFTFKFPERQIRHILIPGVSLGGDYDSDSRKLYMMYGVELNYLRMYGNLGVGAGVWYRQSFGAPDRIDAGVKVLGAIAW